MSSETLSDATPIETFQRPRLAPSSSNLALTDEATANHEIQELFDQYRARFARTELPGILLCFATDAGLLKGMLVIAERFLFGQSTLSQQHKEMIATYISHENDCRYCADSHAALLGAAGGTSEMICALNSGHLDGRLFTPEEIALLRFTAKVNTNSSGITRIDVEEAMIVGWTEAQLAEAVHITGLFAAFNRIANGFGLPSPFSKE